MRGGCVEPKERSGEERREKEFDYLQFERDLGKHKPAAGIAVPLIVGTKRPGFRNETVGVTGDVRRGKKTILNVQLAERVRCTAANSQKT